MHFEREVPPFWVQTLTWSHPCKHYVQITEQALHKMLVIQIMNCILCCSLEVIPGFQTSILQYEQDVLLEIDIAHKILRTNTVLEAMYELYNSDSRGFHNNAMKQIVGSIVMTRYPTSLSCCLHFAVVFIVLVNQLMA